MKREVKVRKALERVKEAWKKMEELEHAEALEMLRKVERLDLGPATSGYVAYLMAICFDVTEDSVMAFRYIEEALAHDPLSIPYNESFGIIVEGIRKSLASPDLDPAAASTPKLYDILIRSGEADTDSHLAMARHLMHADDFQGALRILRAVTVLDPTSHKAWRLTADVARELGDVELELQAKAEALEQVKGQGQDVVFGIPAANARS